MKRFLLGLEEVTKLTQLESLKLHGNQLTDLSPLAKLTMLEQLHLNNNPNLTQIEVDKLQKALPKCEIKHNAKE
jgi:Leucine-rich repeat (LRR) protein